MDFGRARIFHSEQREVQHERDTHVLKNIPECDTGKHVSLKSIRQDRAKVISGTDTGTGRVGQM